MKLICGKLFKITANKISNIPKLWIHEDNFIIITTINIFFLFIPYNNKIVVSN